jgi:hypothetical protein
MGGNGGREDIVGRDDRRKIRGGSGWKEWAQKSGGREDRGTGSE